MPIFAIIEAQQFYTNFPVLMSPLSQSRISEEEFKNFDLYFSFILNPSLKTVGKAFRSP